MSYPSQPQYQYPYGQPPQKQGNNLWMIGGTVIAVLAVLMTVILVLVHQNANSNVADDPTEDIEEETTSEGEETTPAGEEETTPAGEEVSGFTEAVCDTYDLTSFEELFGAGPDPDRTITSATSAGATGSVNCSFSTADYDSASIYVDVTSDAEYNIEWIEDEREIYADADYEITDYDELGDAGYMRVYSVGSVETIGIAVAIQNIEVEVDITIVLDKHGHDEGVAVAEDLLMQGYLKFAGYEQ